MNILKKLNWIQTFCHFFLSKPHVVSFQYYKIFIPLFFSGTNALMLWLAFRFLALLSWAQRACLGLIRESLSDTGMTLNMSWHNASAPSRLSGRSGISRPRPSHLMLLFFFERDRVRAQFALFVCVRMCFTNQLSKVLHITFSSGSRCCATS